MDLPPGLLAEAGTQEFVASGHSRIVDPGALLRAGVLAACHHPGLHLKGLSTSYRNPAGDPEKVKWLGTRELDVNSLQHSSVEWAPDFIKQPLLLSKAGSQLPD